MENELGLEQMRRMSQTELKEATKEEYGIRPFKANTKNQE